MIVAVAVDGAGLDDPAAFVRVVATRMTSSAYASATTYVAFVAPGMFAHVAPPSPEYCHW